MGQPNWTKIPFEKMPQWKKDQLLGQAKETIVSLETKEFVCDVCQKVCKNKLGLISHKRTHNK